MDKKELEQKTKDLHCGLSNSLAIFPRRLQQR